MFSAKDIEKAVNATDSQTFGLYIGYQEISGCIGPTKIGRTVNVKAIQRGRAQGGANWWFHSFWKLTNKEDTYKFEKIVKKALANYQFTGKQNQRELYELSLEDAHKKMTDIMGPSTINYIG